MISSAVRSTVAGAFDSTPSRSFVSSIAPWYQPAVVVQRPQRVEHRVEPLEVAGVDPVAPCLAQVAEVGFQLGEAEARSGPERRARCSCATVGVVLGVGRRAASRSSGCSSSSLSRVLADRPEHREPPVTLLVEAADEALVDERDEAIGTTIRLEALEAGGDRLHRLDARRREDREQPEDRPLVVVEQALAPLDRAPQRLLTLREVARVAASTPTWSRNRSRSSLR